MKRRYIELIWFKALSELRAEAARAYLGFVWWVVEPMMYMAAFYVVFGIVLGRGGEDFVPFLLCGLVVWKWFATTILMSTNSITANAGLMQQVYLPKFMFPAIMISINTIKFFVVFFILLMFLIFYGYKPSLEWLYLPVVLIVQLLLISGISGIVASIVPFFPDLKLLLDNVIMLLMFISGIFFDISNVQTDIYTILRLNPMMVIIESYRDILLSNKAPDLVYLGWLAVSSILLLAVAYAILKKYDRIYPRVII